jgi:hypothetical protein
MSLLHTRGMSGIWSDVTAEDLRPRVEETQHDLERLVWQRRRMRRDVPERNAISYGYDLTIYAANARVETIALLLARLELPAAQHVWDRHLVVYLHAAIEAYPKMVGKLVRECQRLESAGPTVVDAKSVSRAQKTYRREMAQLPEEFLVMLRRVRNTVGAHHLTSATLTPASDLGIGGLIDSVETQMKPGAEEFETLSRNALIWSMRAMKCGQESFKALNVLDLPEAHEDDDYARRVEQLDAEFPQQPGS